MFAKNEGDRMKTGMRLKKKAGIKRAASLSQETMKLLMDYLIEQKPKPGSQIPTEAELADYFEVGKGTIREAIKMLSILGVVEIRRGVGTFIPNEISDSILSPLLMSIAFETEKSSGELSSFRVFVEVGAAYLVNSLAEDVQITHLQEINEQLLIAGKQKKPEIESIIALDKKFHEEFIKLTGNRFICKLMNIVYQLFIPSMTLGIEHNPTSPAESHNVMLEALERRDYQALATAIAESYIGWPK